MNVIELCRKCSFINTSETKSESIANRLLKVADCRLICYKTVDLARTNLLMSTSE